MLRKIMMGLTVIGSIIFITGICYLPSNSGPVPIGEDPEQYRREQNQIFLNSAAFKCIIAGFSIFSLAILYIFIESFYDNMEIVIPEPVAPLTNVIVQDVKPSEPILHSLKIQPASPPAQLIPENKLKFMYPPPYEAMNRGR